VADRDSYLSLARRGILELLDSELAAVWPEVEAKIAERRWSDLSSRVNPHILTQARQQLLAEGAITQETSPTRGGHEVTVLQPANLSGRKRKAESAAGRKRLLYARHQSWARGTKRTPKGLIGPGGETAVAHALKAAAWVGFKVDRTEAGEVRELLGQPVPGGPLDNAALLQLTDEQGRPQGSALLPIEVKNLRTWIYPRAQELHQLLYKAARLSQMHPDTNFLPLLTCRRFHYWTFQMAKDLGFYVIGFERQFILPHAELDQDHFEEVRSELGYLDLSLDMEPYEKFVGWLENVPKYAAENVSAWNSVGSTLVNYYDRLRRRLTPAHRAQTMNELRDAVLALIGTDPRW
jgi:hypothetical protein